MVYVLVLIQVLLLVSGQTMWKIGIDKYEHLSLSNILSVIFSPYVIAGLSLYVIATFLWFYIISIAKDSFSVVYPLGSLAYFLGILVAWLVFKENIPVIRWLGGALILIGCFLIARP